MSPVSSVVMVSERVVIVLLGGGGVDPPQAVNARAPRIEVVDRIERI